MTFPSGVILGIAFLYVLFRVLKAMRAWRNERQLDAEMKFRRGFRKLGRGYVREMK